MYNANGSDSELEFLLNRKADVIMKENALHLLGHGSDEQIPRISQNLKKKSDLLVSFYS